MTTGTMLLMWLGEQITDRGIGNGISLIITIGILARLPQAATGFVGHVFGRRDGGEPDHHFMFIGVMLVLLLCAVIGGRHRGDAGAAENSRAIRPARRRAQNVFRRQFVHAVARQLFGRHADHFCLSPS